MKSALVSIVTSVASGAKLLEDRPRERADTRAIFDEQLGVFPVDAAEHLVDQHAARRDDRADHHRVLQEAAQELPARA